MASGVIRLNYERTLLLVCAHLSLSSSLLLLLLLLLLLSLLLLLLLLLFIVNKTTPHTHHPPPNSASKAHIDSKFAGWAICAHSRGVCPSVVLACGDAPHASSSSVAS